LRKDPITTCSRLWSESACQTPMPATISRSCCPPTAIPSGGLV